MKTILHVLNTGGYSGAENVVIQIITSLTERCPGVRFVYVSPDGYIRQVLAEKQIGFEPVKKTNVRELRRVIRKYHPAFIHAHDFTASIVAAVAAGRVPVISHIHNNSPWIGKVCPRSVAYGLSCRKYTRMLGVSPSVFEEFVYGKRFADKETVIGNPVDTRAILRLAEAEAAQTDRAGYDIVALGRMTEQKAPLRFVSIISRLVNDKGMKITAAMVGDGELRGEVMAKIAEDGLGDVITLTGFMKNPYGLLRRSKVLCMTSAWEGFGLAAVEALALGKPVAATPVGGLPTIITPEGKEGRLCTADEEFVSYLSTLLTDPKQYRAASAAALARAAALDNTEQYYRTLAEIYGL